MHTLSPTEHEALIDTLKVRFEKYRHRHPDMEWGGVEERLRQNSEKLFSLSEMERTGGEPDVIGYDAETQEYIFYDCSPESPA
mgnify:FL=1